MFKKKPREGDSPQSAAPGGKKHFLRRRWPLLVIAGAAVVGVGVWAGQHRASEVAGGIDYIEVTPARRSITNTYSESGTLSAAESYQVKSLVRGDVLTADFEEGDRVEEGDVLFTIDSSDAANSVERARLTLSQAERDYADAADAGTIRTDIGGTVVSISVAPGDVVTAGQEVAVIRDDTSMLLTVDFPAADAAGFAAGQAAEVTLDGTYEKLTGAVRSVSGTDTLSEGNMLVRSVTIAVPNAGGLTAAQAATASVNGVSALGSAKLRSQNTQTLTADASGTVAALCVSEGSRVGAGSAILQLTSDSLTRQAEQAADSTSGPLSSVLGWLSKGASYVCIIDGENATLNTAVKYPVVAGGIAVGRNVSGEVTSMRQLAPVLLDGLGAASAASNGVRYETADEMQVYLWYKGQYFATTLSQVDPEHYYLIGWRDAMGCAAGGRIRVLVAVKKD